VDVPLATTSYASTSQAAADLDRQLAEAKGYLESVAQPLRESGVNVTTEALWGDPAESIIGYLKDHPTQLLVMATRGKSRLNRMVFGSVSESVIRLVKVTPLLLVSDKE
jgi:nucleotide-binding universal stress UspA family protein